MSDVPGALLTLKIRCANCPKCGGDHDAVLFHPGVGPKPGHTHYATCPATDEDFWMDTQGRVGVWESLLRRAGMLPDPEAEVRRAAVRSAYTTTYAGRGCP